ncbi:MAG: hypothetical protein Q4D71_06580 [Oscillospiraceae bacterium]|nr:hypothetical protein [Oscillospiraceae bacterium]
MTKKLVSYLMVVITIISLTPFVFAADESSIEAISETEESLASDADVSLTETSFENEDSAIYEDEASESVSPECFDETQIIPEDENDCEETLCPDTILSVEDISTEESLLTDASIDAGIDETIDDTDTAADSSKYALPEPDETFSPESDDKAGSLASDTPKNLLKSPKEGWVNEGNYRYYYINGEMCCNGVWYIDDSYYGFDKYGRMVTGWYEAPYADSYGNANWYYFDSNGKGHYGWVKDNTYWYYCNNGIPYKNLVMRIESYGASYGFDIYGHMVTGWLEDSLGNKYYFESSGKGRNGWIKDGSYWFFCTDGRIVKNTVYLINDIYYGFDSSGHMVTGWFKPSNYTYNGKQPWFYFDSSGKGHNGWVKDSKYWYFCDNGIAILDTVRTINGYTYGFDDIGHMVTGWFKKVWSDDDIEWYYFDSDGKGHDGWIKDSKYWYFCVDGNASYYQGIRNIYDVNYCFASDGHMLTGWYKDDLWWYFDANGKGHNGWIKDSKNWYYCVNGETYINGVYKINGIAYAFDSAGRMKTGWFKDPNRWHNDEPVWCYFDSDGKGHNGFAEDSKHTYYCINGDIQRYYYVTVDGVRYYCDKNGYVSVANKSSSASIQSY